MRRRKPALPKWKYAFSCRNCQNVQFIKDDAKGREGDYCVKAAERADAGLPGPIHVDEEDRSRKKVIRRDTVSGQEVFRDLCRPAMVLFRRRGETKRDQALPHYEGEGHL